MVVDQLASLDSDLGGFFQQIDSLVAGRYDVQPRRR